VGEASDLRGAVFEVRSGQPDVVLLDTGALGEPGVGAAVGDLQREAPAARVVLLGTEDDPDNARAALLAGASGYVLRGAADAELAEAIRRVSEGELYVHPALAARMVAAEVTAHAAAGADPLSTREREVLRLLALGHTNQEVADQLFLSVRTVETHRAHIMRKLGLESRAELVRYAIDHGQLATDPQ